MDDEKRLEDIDYIDWIMSELRLHHNEVQTPNTTMRNIEIIVGLWKKDNE